MFLKEAVFLDRDGTLIKDAGYLRKKEDICLLPGAVEAVRQINRAGVPAVIVSNQSAVARGILTIDQLIRLQQEIETIFQSQLAYFDAFYFCPHHPEMGDQEYRIECDCRKPRPGMLIGAARELYLDLSRSVMIGDSESDVIAGQAAGCSTVLIAKRSESSKGPQLITTADFVASDILNAAKWSLEKIGEGKSD